MNRRTKSDWQDLFNEHKQSGLTAVAFCQERNLNPKYFCLRRKQLQINNECKATSAFTAVTLPSLSATSMIELQINDTVKLSLPQTISPTWLVDFIHQLRA
jgi:hypothetical protein